MRIETASLPALLDEARHAEALTWLAADSLTSGDAERAFMLADRRCRLARLPTARHYLLRAEAARRLGDAAGANADLVHAAEIDPTDILVNRNILASPDLADDHERAARAILEAIHGEPGGTRAAVAALRRIGKRGVLHARASGARLTGWAAWNGDGTPMLDVRPGAAVRHVALRADPSHWLRNCFGHATGIELELPPAEHSVSLALLLDGQSLDTIAVRGPTPIAAPRRRVPRAAPSDPPAARPVAIIVPAYDDFAATRTCLLQAQAQRASAAGLRIIVVDDASPDPQITAFLDHEAQAGRLELIRNAENLGFAASVNRALAATRDEDALLLNADAYLPEGAVARLADLARSGRNIGTLTPLSNNGEFVSFPRPNQANPLPSPELAAELDRFAAEANAGTLVDLPSGTGFCLFITRACLDAVGPLSTLYVQGYYEDVEFCLQARAAGFRNACAASVYVAHAGSRSFGPRKRALVVRNLAVLKRRYPDHEAHCRAFARADPLAPARTALEQRLRPAQGVYRLLVAGPQHLESGLRERARQLSREGRAALLLSWRIRGGTFDISVENDSGEYRRSLTLPPQPSAGDCRFELPAAIDRIEISAPEAAPTAIGAALAATGSPIDLLVMDGSGPTAAMSPPEPGVGDRAPEPARQRAVASGERLIALDAMSYAFAERGLGRRPASSLPPVATAAGKRATQPSQAARLGVLVLVPSAAVDRLLLALAGIVTADMPDPAIIVLGESEAALRLIAHPRVFVTGTVAPGAYEGMLRRYSIGRLFLPYRDRLFWLIDGLARASGLPAAYFDWSLGAHERQAGDLAIDPRGSDKTVAAELAGWAASRGATAGRA